MNLSAVIDCRIRREGAPRVVGGLQHDVHRDLLDKFVEKRRVCVWSYEHHVYELCPLIHPRLNYATFYLCFMGSTIYIYIIHICIVTALR
jgi:hypothetical protein